MRIFLMYITFDLPLVWSSKQELSIACIHISTQFSMPCNYYVIKCICESFFFVFLFFSSFSLQFSLLVSIARDIFSFSHELRVLSYSLTYSVYISHAKRQAIVGWVSLSCDQDGGMKTIKLRVLLAHVED